MSIGRIIALAIGIINTSLGAVQEAVPVTRTARDGLWSAPGTWEKGRVPRAGEKVLVRAGHTVTYDIESDTVIRSIHVGGTLTFARDHDTKLCVGLLKVQPGEDTSEDGFDCHASVSPAKEGGPRGMLEVGSAEDPIPAAHTALIRLTEVAGLDPQSCPAIISCGGRLELHGTPLARTWVKLGKTNENSADFEVHLAEHVDGWKKGDQILVTGTRRQFPGHAYGNFTKSVGDAPQSETGKIGKLYEEGGHTVIELADYPLANRHEGGSGFSGEVANLSRNVIIESADPKGARGHTMFHRNSAGSITYAEFRHLGKEGVLGRYPIHFHLCGDTMRGTSIVGVSIWDSANRFLTIHGTDYLVVRDCVGFRSIGHGFFLEDGTETRNVLDHNLSCLALRGKPLPDQVLTFDQNDGAGFWWSNSLNSFTRNVAVEQDQHGFRFEVVQSAKFDPVLSVRQPDGTKKPVDIRTLPFIRFEDNEAHCQRRFGINLGGFNGQSMLDLPTDGKMEDVDGVGPDKHHPFNLINTRLWDCDWAYHSGCPSVLNQRMTIFRVLYGVWRINGHLQEHEKLTINDVIASSFFFPRATRQQGFAKDEQLEPVDDFPPVTIVTSIRHRNGRLMVGGTATDNGDIKRVLVNGQAATATSNNFATWEITLSPADEITAYAEDAAGNVERMPHRLSSRPAAGGSVVSSVQPAPHQ